MTNYKKLRQKIENNKFLISDIFENSESTKRLNNLNWLRHEISYTEPRMLFQIPTKNQQPFLDFNCMRNIGTAYDYIINNPQMTLDEYCVCNIHYMLCTDTYIDGGKFRNTTKILQIYINGNRMYAPDATEIKTKLNDIIFKANNPIGDVLYTAFSTHYDLIALQPFDVFNKRTARLIMNWILIKNGFSPIVFNSPKDKKNYITAITENANDNHKNYNHYMLSVMARTQDNIIKLLKKSRIL